MCAGVRTKRLIVAMVLGSFHVIGTVWLRPAAPLRRRSSVPVLRPSALLPMIGRSTRRRDPRHLMAIRSCLVYIVGRVGQAVIWLRSIYRSMAVATGTSCTWPPMAALFYRWIAILGKCGMGNPFSHT